MLKKKATNLARVLALSHCSANAAWLFYSNIYMKAVGYPLSISRLSKTQLKELQGPIVSLTLNRMYHFKRTAQVLVFGPHHSRGLEFGTLETTQGAGRLILLIGHLRTPDGQPHNVLLIVLDRLQYMAGVGFNIMEDTKILIPHLEGIWLPTAQAYMGQISGSMKITGTKIQPLERQGNKYIMDIALRRQSGSGSIRINPLSSRVSKTPKSIPLLHVRTLNHYFGAES
jgi:hypothetical protein